MKPKMPAGACAPSAAVPAIAIAAAHRIVMRGMYISPQLCTQNDDANVVRLPGRHLVRSDELHLEFLRCPVQTSRDVSKCLKKR